MKILPIQSTPQFRSCARRYPAGFENDSIIRLGQVLTNTSVFREDLDWNFLADYIVKNFKDKKRFNTHCLACSDGSEPYSFAISLMERIPDKEYDKYFPIYASDADYESIRAAESGRINLTVMDSMKIADNVKSGREYFIDNQKPIMIKNNKTPTGYFYQSYKPIEKLKNAVIFEQADLMKKIKLIRDEGNSLILMRNVALYLKSGAIKEIAKIAGEVLKKGSLFAAGEYDLQRSYLIEELLQNGFKEIKPFILKKI